MGRVFYFRRKIPSDLRCHYKRPVLVIRHVLLLPVLVNLTRTLRQDFGKLEHAWFSDVCLCSIPESIPLSVQ